MFPQLGLLCRPKRHMVLLIFFIQNSCSRFLNISKKRSKKYPNFFMHDYNTIPYPVWSSKIDYLLGFKNKRNMPYKQDSSYTHRTTSQEFTLIIKYKTKIFII